MQEDCNFFLQCDTEEVLAVREHELPCLVQHGLTLALIYLAEPILQLPMGCSPLFMEGFHEPLQLQFCATPRGGQEFYGARHL